MSVQNDRVTAFRPLHASGCFVMPNPWDVGSARALEQMGFKALATTSAGLAWTLGRADGQVTLDQALEHLRARRRGRQGAGERRLRGRLRRSTRAGRGQRDLAAATGIAGLSIEDSTGDEADPLFEFELAVERIRAARRAIDDSGTGIVLTGRSEGFVSDGPTSTRRSDGCVRTPKPAPTASTHPGSATSTSRRSSPPWPRSR